MYYDTKSDMIDDDTEKEEEESDDEPILRHKSKGKSSKQSSKSSKKQKGSKQSKKRANDKSSKNAPKKKSRAIIEDDDDDDDDMPVTATSLAGASINDIKSNLEEDDDDDEEEEDDDEEAAKEEFNDFIDDNLDDDDEDEKDSEKSSAGEEVEEEEDANNSKRHKREDKKVKKKKKDKKSKKKKKGKSSDNSGSSSGSSDSSDDDISELEEDDLDLIKNNLNVDDLEEVGIAAKKRRRIKFKSESSSEDGDKAEAERQKLKDKKKSKSQPKKTRIEGDEDDDDHNKRSSGGGRNLDYEAESDEESFIVDDSEDDAENNKNDSEDGEQRRARHSDKEIQQKKKRTFNDDAQQEALDIFGVNAEELGAVSDDSDVEDEEYDEDLEEEIEEEEDDEALEKEIEEDDDLTQKAAKKRQKQRRLKVMHKIEDIFEPQELEKNLLTENDQQIRIEDKPERFMLRALPVTTEPNDYELEREAEWIFNQVFQSKKTISNQEHSEPKPYTAVQKIRDALNFIRNEFLEVPFIAFYRKEYIDPELSIQDLWKIYEMDEKYCQLKLRKENLLKLFERMKKYQTEEQIPLLNKKKYKRVLLNDDDDEATEVEDETIINLIESMRILNDQDLDRVRSVQTIDEFLDCYHHFHLHYSTDLISMKEYELKETIKASKQRNAPELDENNLDTLADIDLDNDILDGAKFMKYASRKDRLYHCKQIGLDLLTKKFGLTCEQFGENLMADYQKHEIDQCDLDPAQLAIDYVREPFFQNVEQVLSTLKYMMSIQLARDPTVRQYVRELYMQNSCLSVKPTMPRGFKEIDESHICYPFKYLKQKPCTDLKQDEFLKLYLAEQENLITIKFETLLIKQIVVDQKKDSADDSKKTSTCTTYTRSIVEKLKHFFQKDEFSYNVEQWNLQRAQVIEDMCTKFLFPDFEKELKSKLLNEAKNYIFLECSKRLNIILKQAPYKPPYDVVSKSGHIDFNENGLTILSIVFTTIEMDEHGGNSLASVAVASCINGLGELDGFVRIRNFNLKVNPNSDQNQSKKSDYLTKEKEEKIEDLNKLKDFILEKKPNIIVINSENKDALLVQDDINKILHEIEGNKGFINLKCEIFDNEIAKLFEASKQSELELGANTPGLVKQSIALGRYVQDPLLCYAQLCNQERDILGIKFHPMQQTLLSMTAGGRQSDYASDLLRLLEIEFINRVNEVGVDLNRCNQSAHTSHCLQFVSGLGPRKAQHIMKVLRHQRSQNMSTLSADKQYKTYPVATNRLFLVTKCTLGRRVFINCAGFIKFDVDLISREIDEDEHDKDSSQIDESKYTEILDSTRIHPETYDWARKMAIDALDIEDNESEANANSALKEILDNPKRLKDLDLDAFAAELVRTGHGIKNLTLYDIRKELMFRYKDDRSELIPMSPEEKFYTLIKETRQSFYAGKLVLSRCVGIARRRLTKEQVEESNPVKDDNTCMWQCSFCKRKDFRELSQVWSHFDTGECPGPPVGVRAMLDNGCSGFIPLKLLSDTQVTNPEDRIKIGMTVHSRITRIDPERFSVELSCKTSDLRDLKDKWKPLKDEYFDYKAQDDDQNRLDEKKKKEEHRQTYTKRIILHPQFKNIGFSQAIAFLKDMDVGDAIIRPSSKGIDHLTVTWKLNKDCYQHVDVLEEKKINSFSIGKRLIIDGEDYEDLDEILARYISPMANCVREIINHKNYKDIEVINSYGQQNEEDTDKAKDLVVKNDQVEIFLLDERAKSPSKIPYLFTCCRNLPGRFMLSYMVKIKLRNEFIKINHDGFKFRDRSFNSFNELVNWFKAHFNDPISTQLSSTTNSNQKVSSQMSGMNLNNSQQNIKTPSYPNSSRTPAQNANNYETKNETSSNSNEYSSSNQSYNEKKADYSTNSGRGGYRGNTRSFNNSGDRGGGRGAYRGRGGRGAGFNSYDNRGGYDRNARGKDWDSSAPVSNATSEIRNIDAQNGSSLNKFNNNNSSQNNNSRNNIDDWDTVANSESQSNNRSLSQNRNNRAEESWDDNDSGRANKAQTSNNNRSHQNYNNNRINSSNLVPSKPTTIDDDDWDY